MSKTDEERKAYTLVHNKLTINSDFDIDILNDELMNFETIDMSDFGFDLDLEDEDEPAVAVYKIVGTLEADPLRQLISNESPLGSAIVNHKVGDKVYVKSESGEEFWVMIHEISSQEIAE